MYKIQRNFCSKLYKKERKNYYDSLNVKNITDNKKFLYTVKPFISDKSTSQSQISLVVDNQIISEDNEIAEALTLLALGFLGV